MPTTYRKMYTDVTEEELMMMTREEACLNLNDKQRKFCEVYVGNFNCKIAAKKAGYSVGAAPTIGWKLRQDPNINRYLAWLKLRVAHQSHISALDIIEHYARIAFADVTDFVDIERNKVRLKDGVMIDGQLIRSIKQGKDGVQIEFHDKLAALAKLELYFDTMPKDWKQKLEEKKVELLEKRLELEKVKLYGIDEEEDGDDGFMDALRGSAKEVWDTEGEENVQ